MKIKVKIHTNSSQEKISKMSDNSYEVWTKSKPINGKANASVIKLLKKYFKGDVEIFSGLNSKNKIVKIK